MDKYDLVLDILANPGKYPPGRLEEILSDPGTREIYDLLCETVTAAGEPEPVDIDRQWKTFKARRMLRPRRFVWLGSRAATIAVALITSLVAVAIGVAVTITVSRSKPAKAEIVAVAEQSATATSASAVTAAPADTVAAAPDAAPAQAEPVLFEDATLQAIMDEVAKTYRVQISFNDKDAAALHLYYKFDPALPLDEIIAQLNAFEQINITRNGDTLIID